MVVFQISSVPSWCYERSCEQEVAISSGKVACWEKIHEWVSSFFCADHGTVLEWKAVFPIVAAIFIEIQILLRTWCVFVFKRKAFCSL